MIPIFNDNDWMYCQCNSGNNDVLLLPSTSFVYAVTIKRRRGKRRVAYIGFTHNIKWRMRNHKLIRTLRYNLNLNKYSIEILYKDFGGALINNRMERDLIRKYNPVFNRTWQYGKPKKFLKFWEYMGVADVVYKKNEYYNSKPVIRIFG